MVIGAAPVGHHEAIEAPLAAQHLAQQMLAVGGELPVHLVVGRHEGGRVRGRDHDLEATQVQLAQRALVDDRVDHHPGSLLVVRGVVLGAGGHPLGLDAAHEGGGQHARQQRVLGEVLEVAPAAWMPLEVQARAEQDGHILGAGLAPQCRADLLEQCGVPGAGQRGGDREARGRHGVVEPDVVRVAGLLAQPVRAVGHHHGRDESRDGLGVPEVAPAQQADPVSQRQSGDDGLSPFPQGLGVLGLRHGTSPAVRCDPPTLTTQARWPGAIPPCEAGSGAAAELRIRLRTKGIAMVSSAI